MKKQFRLRKLAAAVLSAALVAGLMPVTARTVSAADSNSTNVAAASTAANTESRKENETNPAVSGEQVKNSQAETAGSTQQSSASATGTAQAETQNMTAGSTQPASQTDAQTAGSTQPATKNEAVTQVQTASAAVKTKLKAARTSAAQTVFKNNGYPYGKDMGSSNVTLVMELENGTVDTAEWSRSTDKDGDYQFIDASALSGVQITNDDVKSTIVLDSSALGNEKYWYRCTVNGKTSEAIQLVYASTSSDSGNSIMVLRSGDSGRWYASNGSMAYNVQLNYNSFNVIGTYTKGNTDYWINTAYGGSWNIYSSASAEPGTSDRTAKLNALRLSFNEADSHRVVFEADLASDQTGLSIGTDVMLADGSITNYADNASLKGIFDSKTDNITSVQMVGAASIDEADVSDPAFVLHYTDTPDRYWIGFYSERSSAYWANNLYDNTGSKSNVKDTKMVNGEKVITEVAGKDSFLTTSWIGREAGSTIKFQFGVGSVEQAGATIKMQTTATTIQVDDADSSLEYAIYGPDNTPLQLTDENGNPMFEADGTTPLYWKSLKDGETSIIFYGLSGNTKYTVMSRKKNTTDTPNKEGDITTNVDPTKPKDDAKPVECTEGTTTLAFINLNTDYTYQLQDEAGKSVSGSSWIPAPEGTITFTGLHPGTDYYLVAKAVDNTRSDKVKYTTLKTKITFNGNVSGEEITVPAGLDKSFSEAVTLPAAVPSRDGYTFIGWSTSKDGSTKVYPAGASFNESSDDDQTLYAIWKKSVSRIDITVKAPVIETAFDKTASGTTAEGIAGISDVTWSPAADAAEYDVEYTASVIATISADYIAAADIKATVNGNEAVASVQEDGTVKISYTFAPLKRKTDAEKIADAEQIINAALADAPAYNGTNRNDLQKLVDKALADAGITDVTAEVEGFDNNNATTDNDGNIKADIKFKTPTTEIEAPVSQPIDKIPSSEDEKLEYAKKVISRTLEDIPDVNNVTREDIQKKVDEALVKAGIPEVEAVVSGVTVNPADSSNNGNIAGNVNISTAGKSADLDINKDISKIPSNDEEKLEYVKKIVQSAVADMTISDSTTTEDIQNVVDSALAKAGITDVDVNVGSLDKVSATTDAAGSFTGNISISSGSASSEATVNKSIAKKPASDDDRIEAAKIAIEEALANADVNNGMSTSDIQRIVDNALNKAGITDVEAVVGAVDKNDATADTAGSIIGDIRLSTSSKEGTAHVDRTIGTVPSTDDEKIQAAKNIVQNVLDNAKIYNSTSKDDIQSKIDEALAKAGLGDVTVTVDDINISSATESASGKATGTISIASGNKSDNSVINKTINKIPSSDEEYAEASKDAASKAIDEINVSDSNTKEDIKKAVEDELAKAGITGAQVVTDDIVIKDATNKANGSITGTVKVIVNGVEKEVTVNRIIPQIPMTDEEKAEEAKDAADKVIGGIEPSNAATKEDIRKSIEDEFAKEGITEAQVDTDNIVIKEATTKAEGSITGTVKVIVNGVEKEITINKVIPKLPMTDEEKAEEAGTVTKDVIKDITFDNEMTADEIKDAVEKAIADSEEFASEVTVTTDVDITEATLHEEGRITGKITIKVGNAEYTIPVDEAIAKLKANVPEQGEVSVDEVRTDGKAPQTELVSSADDVKKVLVLTRSELAKVNAGHNINIFLRVELKTANVTDEERAVIEASKKDYTIGEYVDVTLLKEIDGSQVKVTELDGKITISIVIPESLRNTDENVTRSYVLLRRHGSETVAEIVDGTYDEDTYTFTFETDRFSTYVIAYKDTVKPAPAPQPSDDDDDSDDTNEQPSAVAPVLPGAGQNSTINGGTDLTGGSTQDNSTTAAADENTSGDTAASAATGDSSPIIPLAVIMLICGACVVFFSKKKTI